MVILADGLNGSYWENVCREVVLQREDRGTVNEMFQNVALVAGPRVAILKISSVKRATRAGKWS